MHAATGGWIKGYLVSVLIAAAALLILRVEFAWLTLPVAALGSGAAASVPDSRMPSGSCCS
jgi:hypothetical protein